MAVKKSKAAKTSGAKAATKTKAPKAKAPAPAAKAAPKVATKAPKAKAAAAAPKAKKAAVKLTPKQTDFLKSIHGHGEAGYPLAKKGEAKSLDSLREKKLVKKGAKNKDTGHVHYHVTKAGEKHLSTSAEAPASGTTGGTA